MEKNNFNEAYKNALTDFKENKEKQKQDFNEAYANAFNKKKTSLAIGSRLKELREAKGYSVRYVGERIGKSYATISNYELGDCEPSITILKKLCSLYDYDMVKFLQDIYDQI